MIIMGYLQFSDNTRYPITMKGMKLTYDGYLDEDLFYDKKAVVICPSDDIPTTYVYECPVVQILSRSDDKTVFKIYSDPYKFDKREEEFNSNLFKTVSQIAARSFADEEALLVKDIYDPFVIGRSYKKDEFFTYVGDLYKVNQDHVSQQQWIPGETGTESLYTKVTLTKGGYPIWQQPTGAHDAYNKGDIVEYRGALHESLLDGNVWSPDTYPSGWKIYDEESSGTDQEPEPGTGSDPARLR